jgi:hypothetical protein
MELLQRRKFCREFLNGYNEKLHPQIISKVFEIGLLILKKRFNKLLFSKEELDDIIKDLNGKDYVEIVPLPPLKKIQKLPTPSKKRSLQHNEGYYINTEKSNPDLIKAKLLRNRQILNNTLQNPNFTTQNSAIYPNWWWNNKEEDEIEKPKNNINIIYSDENNYDNIDNYNYNYDYEENENNRDYIEINEGGDNKVNYQNYIEKPEMENDEVKNKNYTIKKLTMNSEKPKINNKYDNHKNTEEAFYYENQNKIPYYAKNMKLIKNFKKIPNKIKKRDQMRVKSTKPPSRKINNFVKNNQLSQNKIIKRKY